MPKKKIIKYNRIVECPMERKRYPMSGVDMICPCCGDYILLGQHEIVACLYE